MDFLNSIAKEVVKAFTNVKPSDAKDMIQPIGHNLEVRKPNTEVHARIIHVDKKKEANDQSTGLF